MKQRQPRRVTAGQTQRRFFVLVNVIVVFVGMRCDRSSTQRCYLCSLWRTLSCFGPLGLFIRKARHFCSVAFVVQHAKHTEWTSLNSPTPTAGKVEFMSPHLSGVVSFYGASGYGFKVGFSRYCADIAAGVNMKWREVL